MHAAILATQPTDNPTWSEPRLRTLTIGGVDYDIERHLAATSWVIPLESIYIEEAGPGGTVSSMDLTILDPQVVVSIPDMAPVEFYDHDNGRWLFRGFVQQATPKALAVGRSVEVVCVGIEAVLDWRILPADVTYAAGLYTVDCIQNLFNRATGVGVALNASSGLEPGGDATNGIGHFGTVDIGVRFPRGLDVAVTVPAGSSLREGIQILCDATRSHFVPFGYSPDSPPFIDATIDVDFSGTVRVFSRFELPDDYGTLTIGESVGSLAATSVEVVTDGLAIPRTAYVKGGNAAGSGPVTDGSGLPGPTIFIQDDTITTAAARDALGTSTLQQQAVAERGTAELEGYLPSADIHAGWTITLTSTPLGVSAQAYAIAAIVKRFVTATGRQDWSIRFGRRRPTAITKTKYRSRS